jgi:hypothetical protein
VDGSDDTPFSLDSNHTIAASTETLDEFFTQIMLCDSDDQVWGSL